MCHLHLEAVAVNPHQSKELSIQEKNPYKSIREIEEWPNQQFGTFWEKKKSTGELSNIKRPGCQRKTTVVDDQRTLSMGKKNPFTTSSHEKNTLQEVDISLSTSSIKRRLHENKYRGFTTRFIQGQIRLCQKTSKKKADHFWKSILWTADIKINLYQNDGKKKVWRRLGTAHDPKHTTSSVKHGGVVWWHEHAWLPVALGYWCLLLDKFWSV